MKPRTLALLAFVLGVGAGFAAALFPVLRYSYQVRDAGAIPVVVRIDRLTGEADWSAASGDAWMPIGRKR
jgi:hypothetical protein